MCFTEHRLFPTDPEIDRTYAELAERFQIAIFKGTEADTDLGHLLMFGVNKEVIRRFDLTSRMLKSEQLIEVLHHEGGVAIPSHPFRHSGFGARLHDLLSRHNRPARHRPPLHLPRQRLSARTLTPNPFP